MQLTVWNDGSKLLLQDRLQTLLNSARQGFLMVLIVLAMFLRPRLAFWVSVGVPVAFLGAIAASYLLGLSIDAISLFRFHPGAGHSWSMMPLWWEKTCTRRSTRTGQPARGRSDSAPSRSPSP